MSSVIKDACEHFDLRAHYEELLYSVHDCSRYGISKAELERRFRFSKNLTGEDCCISYAQIEKIRKKVTSDLVSETVYRCGGCAAVKATEYGNCVHCQAASGKRSTLHQAQILRRFNISHQLKRIISWHGQNIIDDRQAFHTGPSPYHEDDMRGRPGHVSKIESAQDFLLNKVIILPALCHIDGTKFDKRSKGADWPWTVALVDLPPLERCVISNLIFGGCYSAYKKPKSTDWGDLMDLSRRDLQILEHIGFRMRLRNVIYTFKLKVSFPIVDLEAMSLVYDFTAAGYYGCPLCNIRGTFAHGAVRFRPVSVGARTDAANRMNSILQQQGWRGDRRMLLMIEMNYVLDFLHVTEEGFFRDLLADICGKSGRREELKLPRVVLDAANKIASMCKVPTYIAGRLRPFEDSVSLANCKERRLTFFIQLLPILASSLNNDVECLAVIVLLFINHRRLFERETPSRVLEDVGRITTEIGRLFHLLFGLNGSTLKTHLFYAHLADQLRLYGNTVDVDTTPFEYLLGRLKREGSPHATRNYLEGSFDRLYLQCISTDEILELGGTSRIKELNTVYEDSMEVRGAKGGAPLNENVVVPLGARLTADEIRTDAQVLDLEGHYPRITPIRRFSFLRQALSVRRHWKKPELSEQSLILVRCGGTYHWGELVAVGIHEDNRSLRMVVSCYKTLFAYDRMLRNLVNVGTIRSNELVQLFRNVVTPNTFIREIDDTQARYDLLCGDNEIHSLFVLVPFDNRQYAVAVPHRGVYV